MSSTRKSCVSNLFFVTKKRVKEEANNIVSTCMDSEEIRNYISQLEDEFIKAGHDSAEVKEKIAEVKASVQFEMLEETKNKLVAKLTHQTKSPGR